jgi:hypothetical protein
MALGAAHSDESRFEDCGIVLRAWCGRGRFRSGSVEAVREYDPGHAREPISVRRDSGRGSGSTKRCVEQLRVLRFHAGENNDDWQYSGN